MPASLTLLRAVGGPPGADFSQGGRGPLAPLKTAPALVCCISSLRFSMKLSTSETLSNARQQS